MPRKTKKEQLQRAQDPAAPFLFDDQHLPYRPDLVKAVKSGEHKHTGARLLDNHTHVLRMVELLMSGWGVKKIAREMGVSAHSVRAARDALVARGEMAPFKERVVRKFEEIIEVGASNYLDALEKNEVPAAQIPVGLGIISDKRALALGEPTSISAAAAGPGQAEDLSVEKLNAWFEGMKVASADPPSGGNPAKPMETDGKEAA